MLQLMLVKMIAKLWRNIVERVHFIKFGGLYMATVLNMKSLEAVFQKFF